MPSIRLRPTRLALTVGAGVLAAGAALTAYVLTAPDADAGITPARASGAPHCHRIADSAPASLGGFSRRDSSLPGVAVWGDRDIILRCGVTPPGLTGNPCFAVDGVDWVYDEAQSTHGRKVVVTYGRNPATQVVFDSPGQTDAALIDLSRLVAPVRQTTRCLAAQ
ncbi:hypothetical protein GCM10022403_064260 [Streptomyces coacervatus]|uniref:DUF3515 domain-containing protein n=1 Tax=Streptomyces coacervatus TaxID=647381 RepID=A0ABP7IMA5_9ACTN|nr:DUF3515 family protein [Streptomyces coacervatus]MDF2268769.1 DUF3515 family protein [Streptomyces coacervatus]